MPQPVPIPHDRAPCDDDAAPAQPLDDRAHAWLRHRRTQRPPHDRRAIALALLVALLVHLLGLWLVRDWMRLRLAPEDRSDVLRVSLVDAPAEPPLSPPEPIAEPEPVAAPQPVAAPARAASRRAAPRAGGTVAAPSPNPATASPLRLYGPDGKLELPPLAAEPEVGPPFGFRAPAVVASPVMRHESPLPYTATEFEPYWPSDDETALDALIRRNTVSKTLRTKDGGQITCTWMLFIGGCGWGYAPPNPEGLKKLRFEAPLKAVTVRQAEQAARAANEAAGDGEAAPALNLNLPAPEEKPVEGDGFQ